jgi:uncharacterized repeat protein (TIGR01451 family)/fimbrial isopeptide formation D2 family protein
VRLRTWFVIGILVGLCAPALALGAGSPPITLSNTAPSSVVFGGTADVTLSAANPTGPYGYNLSFSDVLPAGVSYVPGSATPAPTTVANRPSAGQTTLIWTNLADLSQNASYSLHFQVTHTTTDPSLIQVGTVYSDHATAYVNTDARQVPQFDTNGAVVGGSFTGSATASTQTQIAPFSITAAGGGKELRGVHDHQFVQTLTIANNDAHPTDNAVVNDYLPAGLEFLGCASADNTTDAPTNPGSTREYPNAAALNAGNLGPLSTNCPTPDLVGTVTDPAGLPAGVYTHVRWTLGTLAPSQVVTIRYATGIPIRENTTTWTGTVPTDTSLGQIANLDNNSGAETRQGQSLVTYPSLSGQYQGPTTPQTPPTQTSSTTITNVAKDLLVNKSASTSAISVGGVTRWTLTTQTSEYRGATAVTLTDTLPNGLCPLGASPAAYPHEPDCSPSAHPGDGPSVPYSSATENSDGTWTLVWNANDMPVNGTQVISFSTLARAFYQHATGSGPADDTNAPVLAGDTWANQVGVAGGTVVRHENGVEINHDAGYATGTAVTDSAGAGQSASLPSIAKWVARPGTVTGGACPTDPADYVPSLAAPASYRPGDLICWRVRVNFGADVSTRITTLTDFLPAGQTYAPGSATGLADNTLNGVDTPDTSTPGQLIWSGLTPKSGPGTVIPASGQAFDTVFASVAAPATTAPPGTVLDNLAKLATTNSAGVSSSPRADAPYTVTGPQLSLTKGVLQVIRPGATSNPVLGPYGPNTDAVHVQPGDTVTYRIDIANAGTNPAAHATIWDVLPSDTTCADVGALGANTTPAASSCTTIAGVGDVVEWTGISVAAGASTTLNVNVTIPLDLLSSFVSLNNTAGVVSYGDGTQTGNSGDGYLYVPTANIDPTQTTANAPAASDPSSVIVEAPAINKTSTTSIVEAGNGISQATIGERIDYTVAVPLVPHTVLTSATITDPIPARVTYVGGSATATLVVGAGAPGPLPGGWSLGVSGSTITITLPPSYTVPDQGALVDLRFSGTVTDSPANTLTSASISNTGTFTTTVGGVTNSTSASVANQVVEPQIAVRKADNTGGQPVAAGQAITYTVTASNGTGARVSAAHNLTVTDHIPVGLCVAPASVSAGGNVAGDCISGQTLTWTLGNVAPGGTQALTYQASVGGNLPALTRLTNTVSETANSIEGGGRQYTVTTSDTVTTSTPTLTKTTLASSGTGTSGTVFPYRVQFTIPAHETLPSAVLTDTLPSGFAFVSQTSATSTCGLTLPAAPTSTSTPVTWTLGDIPGSATSCVVTFDYATLATTSAPFGIQTNTAALTWSANGATQRLSDTAHVLTAQPELTLNKTVSCDGGASNTTDHHCHVIMGTPLVYSVAVTNTGARSAFDATITDTPDPAIVGITAISNGGTLAGGAITWHLTGPIAAGQTVVLTYQAAVVSSPTAVTNGQAIVNTAQVGTYYGLTAAERQAHPADAITYPGGAHDSDVLTLHIPTLEIAKTHEGDLVRGGTGTYDITVTNISHTPTTGPVTVTDTPPGGMMPLSAAGPGWHCSIAVRTMRCTRSDVLAPGASFPPITLEVAIASNAPDDLVNVAAASGGGGPPERVVTEDPTHITGPITDARVTITKSASPVYVRAGHLVRYRIAIHAPGPSAVFDAIVCDRIPAYTTYVAAPGGTYRHGTVCWSVPYLAVGQTDHFSVIVRVHASAPPIGIVNTATVTARNAPPAHASAKVRVLTRPRSGGGVTG